MLTTNRKQMQGCVMKMKKINKITTAHNLFVTKKAKFDRPLQKPVGTNQDETSSIKVPYNKGIHTVVLT